MIKTISLQPGVTLRCFRDSRFKQGFLSIQFIRPMDKEEAALNALIPAVLLRGSENTPDMRSITLRLDDLYGAALGPLLRRIGDYHAVGLYASFISDKYALEGDPVLEPAVAFMEELLLHPALEAGVFRAEYIQSEKKNLISTIEAQRNDKRAYAAAQLFGKMCSGDSYGIPRLGEASQVKKITPQGAYAHYKKLLAESRADIFYVGQAEPERVAKLVAPIFQKINRNYVNLPEQTPFCPQGGGEHTETMEIAQGKLCMGFATDITLGREDFAAMQVCNTLFGGGMTSKLFMNIREKMSLCYDISSAYYGSKGIVTVSAGIDCDKESVVREQVLEQLAAIERGEVSAQELNAAKQGLVSSLQGIHDTPGGIENYSATGAVSGLGMTPEEYIRKVEEVTPEQVYAAARTVKLDTVFFLKGVQ